MLLLLLLILLLLHMALQWHPRVARNPQPVARSWCRCRALLSSGAALQAAVSSSLSPLHSKTRNRSREGRRPWCHSSTRSLAQRHTMSLPKSSGSNRPRPPSRSIALQWGPGPNPHRGRTQGGSQQASWTGANVLKRPHPLCGGKWKLGSAFGCGWQAGAQLHRWLRWRTQPAWRWKRWSRRRPRRRNCSYGMPRQKALRWLRQHRLCLGRSLTKAAMDSSLTLGTGWETRPNAEIGFGSQGNSAWLPAWLPRRCCATRGPTWTNEPLRWTEGKGSRSNASILCPPRASSSGIWRRHVHIV